MPVGVMHLEFFQGNIVVGPASAYLIDIMDERGAEALAASQ